MDVLQFIKSNHERILAAWDEYYASTTVRVKRELFQAVYREVSGYQHVLSEYLLPEVCSVAPSSGTTVSLVAEVSSRAVSKRLKSLDKIVSKPGSPAASVKKHSDTFKRELDEQFQSLERIMMPLLRESMRTEEREDLGKLLVDLSNEYGDLGDARADASEAVSAKSIRA